MESSIRVETVATLASRLEMTRDAVVREVVEGRLPYVNVGGHWRFREMDIEYWQRSHGRDARLKLVGERDSD
ncbi:MAG TPA: helix-turn-helix domain-containing protein [Acidobacteriota bacterium]|nr:helix-turn-helix domain-containing protein [Acidobacteriota bacterium]